MGAYALGALAATRVVFDAVGQLRYLLAEFLVILTKLSAEFAVIVPHLYHRLVGGLDMVGDDFLLPGQEPG